VGCIGGKERRNPNLSFQSIRAESRTVLVDQFEGFNTLSLFGPFGHGAINVVIRQRIEVVVSINAQNEQACQGQPQHDAEEVNVLSDGVGANLFHENQTRQRRVKFTR
jgi:hypothetical protein